MIRIVIAAIIIALATAALARQMPMIPYSQPSGSMLGLGGPMIPGNIGGGSPPPPTCSNKLDFTQACNSQYVSLL